MEIPRLATMRSNMTETPNSDPGAGVRRLFLALLPAAEVRQALAQAALAAGVSRDPSMRPVDARRYHATLHFLGTFATPRPDLVDAVERIASELPMAAFEWTLDRVRSFHGRRPPRVLCGSVVPTAFEPLWQQWRDLLRREAAGLPLEERFMSHVTLAYGRAVLPEAAVPPVHWPVRELALLESRAGPGEYRRLASWPLLPT